VQAARCANLATGESLFEESGLEGRSLDSPRDGSRVK
jgi:hypothetical protein